MFSQVSVCPGVVGGISGPMSFRGAEYPWYQISSGGGGYSLPPGVGMSGGGWISSMGGCSRVADPGDEVSGR